MSRRHARTFVVQHILAAVVLALLVPAVAHADSTVTIDNSGGVAGATVSGGIPGAFSLTGSRLVTIDGAPVSGSLSFKTGSWAGGSLSCNSCALGTVLGDWNPGGSFTIKESGATIFTGAFTGDVSWTFGGCTSGQCYYTLTGSISGTYMGAAVSGVTTQINLTTSGNYTGGMGSNFIKDKTGTTNVFGPQVVPEPGSLALMGTGLLGVAFAMRRKIKNGGQPTNW
jgi:hypothetical protein